MLQYVTVCCLNYVMWQCVVWTMLLYVTVCCMNYVCYVTVCCLNYVMWQCVVWTLPRCSGGLKSVTIPVCCLTVDWMKQCVWGNKWTLVMSTIFTDAYTLLSRFEWCGYVWKTAHLLGSFINNESPRVCDFLCADSPWARLLVHVLEPYHKDSWRGKVA